MLVNIKELVLESTVWFGTLGHRDFSKSQLPRAGMYLFYDGSCQVWPQFGHEKGIFIDAQRFIPLEKLNPSLLNKAQVLEYCEKNNLRIPYLCELVGLLHYEDSLTNAVRQVNQAFDGYNRRDCHLPENIVDACWYQEALDSSEEVELRRLVLVENLGNQSAAKSLVFTDYEMQKPEIFVTPDGQVWYRKDDRFVPGNLYCMAQVSEKLLLTAETSILFVLENNVLRYIGHSPKKFGTDVIMCWEGIFQICPDKLHCLKPCNANHVEFDEKGQLVVTICDEFYGGSEQYLRERYVTYYKRDENGLWQETGHIYHSN